MIDCRSFNQAMTQRFGYKIYKLSLDGGIISVVILMARIPLFLRRRDMDMRFVALICSV